MTEHGVPDGRRAHTRTAGTSHTPPAGHAPAAVDPRWNKNRAKGSVSLEVPPTTPATADPVPTTEPPTPPQTAPHGKSRKGGS